MTDSGTVVYTASPPLAHIEFYHPKGNSLPSRILEELTLAFRRASEEPDLRVITLQSRGDGAFCGGANLDELRAIRDFESGKAYFMRIAELLTAMRDTPGCIIAKVQGPAVGGGVGLIAASDFVCAGQDAPVRLSEVSLGIGPFVIGPAVIRKIGLSAFSTLSLDAGTWYDAHWARSFGLYNRVVESHVELDRVAEQLAGDLAASGPSAVTTLKRELWRGENDWPARLEESAEQSAKLLMTEHTQRLLHR